MIDIFSDSDFHNSNTNDPRHSDVEQELYRLRLSAMIFTRTHQMWQQGHIVA